MIQTEKFLKYEKTTNGINIASVIIAVVAFLTIAGGLGLLFLVNSVSAFGDETQSNDSSVLIFSVIAVGVGLFAFVALPLRIVGLKRRQNVALCRSYERVLSHDPHNAVEEIHQATGEKNEKIVADFKKLNALGFFSDLHINEEECVVNRGETSELREFVCPACGGVTMIKNGCDDTCEYCGAIAEKEND